MALCFLLELSEDVGQLRLVPNGVWKVHVGLLVDEEDEAGVTTCANHRHTRNEIKMNPLQRAAGRAGRGCFRKLLAHVSPGADVAGSHGAADAEVALACALANTVSEELG